MTDARVGAPPPARARRAALAGGVGTLIEYYDFTIYAFLTVTIAPLFFPSGDPAVSVLSTLAVFAGGYLVRPLGGVFFGRLGDRHGRRPALVATVVSMGVCSILLGVLPTYEQIGVAAPALLVLVRLLQGFSAGGEIGGAMTYIAESAPLRRRSFYGSFTPLGSNLGFALSAAVVGLTTALTTSEQMSAWGWRLPFLLCVPLTIICLLVRMKLEDTPEFREMSSSATVVRTPLRDLVAAHKSSVLRVIGIAVATNGAGYVGSTYMSVYLINDVGLPATTVFWLVACALVFLCACMPPVGLLADHFGRKRVFLVGAVAILISVYPLLALMGTGGLVAVTLAYLAYMALGAVIQVPAFTLFSDLFPPQVRYTGVSLGFNIATVVAGGTAPYIAAQLVESTGDPLSPAFWVIGVVVIGAATMLSVSTRSHSTDTAGAVTSSTR